MALVPALLADKIKTDMGFAGLTSAQLLGWATGVIDEIQNVAVVTNVSGITGTCLASGPAPLSSGIGTGGVISAMTGSSMATKVKNAAGYPFVSTQLTDFCTGIVNHIQSLGTMEFASGGITGTCTNTLVVAGPLTSGAGINGTISGLNGPVLALDIHNAVGYPGSVSTKLVEFCTAFTDYIMSDGVGAYASGQVTGTCPAGGGPLEDGAGVSGTIS